MANVQIRDVDPEVHRRLKEIADRKGMSLSEYLRVELSRISRLPSWEEINVEIDKAGRVELPPGLAAAIIRERRGPLP